MKKDQPTISGAPAIGRRYHQTERDIVSTKPKRPTRSSLSEALVANVISSTSPVDEPHSDIAPAEVRRDLAKAALEKAESSGPVGKGGVFVRLSEEQLRRLDSYRGKTTRAEAVRDITLGFLSGVEAEIITVAPKKTGKTKKR